MLERRTVRWHVDGGTHPAKTIGGYFRQLARALDIGCYGLGPDALVGGWNRTGLSSGRAVAL